MAGGISIASAGSLGGVCVTGKTSVSRAGFIDNGEQNRAGTVLDAFLAPTQIFVTPEV